MLRDVTGMVKWHFLIAWANRYIDELDHEHGATAAASHWAVSVMQGKRALAASAAAAALQQPRRWQAARLQGTRSLRTANSTP